MEHNQSSNFCLGPDDFCWGPAPVGPTLVTGPQLAITRETPLAETFRNRNWQNGYLHGWPSSGEHTTWLCNQPPRPTQPSHSSVLWHSEYWRWFRPPLGKNQRLLRNSRSCYTITSLVPHVNQRLLQVITIENRHSVYMPHALRTIYDWRTSYSIRF